MTTQPADRPADQPTDEVDALTDDTCAVVAAAELARAAAPAPDAAPDSTPAVMTVEVLAVELRDMLEVSRRDRSIATRLAGGRLRICYDFLLPDGTTTPYLMTIDHEQRVLEPVAAVVDDADIVLRAEPQVLHDLTSGDLNGREAIMSGRLDIRKAPSLPKLLMMRGLFNQYKKALARGEVAPVTS